MKKKIFDFILILTIFIQMVLFIYFDEEFFILSLMEIVILFLETIIMRKFIVKSVIYKVFFFLYIIMLMANLLVALACTIPEPAGLHLLWNNVGVGQISSIIISGMIIVKIILTSKLLKINKLPI